MDKCTHEVRMQYWAGIIAQCHARPEGQSAKQWLKDNGIRETTYYLWQRRIRQDVYGQLRPGNAETETLSTEKPSGGIVFAELPSPTKSLPAPSALPKDTPAVTIKVGNACIELMRDISEEMLTLIIREAAHA